LGDQIDRELMNYCKRNHKLKNSVFDLESQPPGLSEISESEGVTVRSQENISVESVDDEEIFRVSCLNRHQGPLVIDVDLEQPSRPNVLKMLVEEQLKANYRTNRREVPQGQKPERTKPVFVI
jgi:hypothetical protein